MMRRTLASRIIGLFTGAALLAPLSDAPLTLSERDGGLISCSLVHRGFEAAQSALRPCRALGSYLALLRSDRSVAMRAAWSIRAVRHQLGALNGVLAPNR